ncbi:DUF6056 family protein [Komagataeibacter intermedius]|nr:DUF6056 family protein [Komagataeibacter intermedius]MCF3636021.1 DUF6056 family protein [Komagataeibacter intermedius]GAN85653.1 hypothetical protein Gain_0007_066 [Komagataeibacter intermedius TF2]GBQ70642.1 hypothetical protein AA0521_1733 [Komagataeibacter intermedius NRIC 0521]
MDISPRTEPGERLGLALCFAFLLWANWITPLWADDYCRTMPFNPATILRIVWGNYNFWTGRWFTTLVTFMVLDLRPYGSLAAFAVVNAGIFTFLVRVVVHMCRAVAGQPAPARLRDGVTQYVLVFLMLWWLPRTIGEVALWKTGSIGYLWPVAGEMWLLARILSRRTDMNMVQYVAVFLIATFLEPLSLLLTLILAGDAARAWKRGQRVPWALACSHAMGTLVLGIAPGNYVRQRTMVPSPPADRLDGLLGNLGSLFDPFWLPFVALIGIGLFMGRRQVSCPACLRAGHGIWFVGLALAYMALLLMFPREALAARVSFPASVLLVCYLACLLFTCPIGRPFGMVLASGCAGLVVMHMVIVVPDLTRLARISHDWVASTREQVARDQPVILPRVTMGPRHKLLYVRKDIIFVGINPDPHNMLTMCFARAMGASTVRSVP